MQKNARTCPRRAPWVIGDNPITWENPAAYIGCESRRTPEFFLFTLIPQEWLAVLPLPTYT
jgi:hypothetical protein